MRNAVIALGIASILIATAVGASAFQTATVDRSATVSVVSDNNALIGLHDGGSGNIVAQNGNTLTVDTNHLNNAGGVNENATYHLGNLSDGDNVTTTSDVYAFNITNNDNQYAHGYSLNFTQNNTASGANVSFIVYNQSSGTWNNLGTATAGKSYTTPKIASGKSVYVDVDINTHNGKTSSITGNLNVTATA